jgi:translation initiation factor 1
MKSRTASGGLVYSTDGGSMCPVCRNPVARCTCRADAAARAPRGDGIVRVRRETKGRGGKGVTVVDGLDRDAPALAELARTLKAACCSGGTVKDGTIEIPGDHRDRVVAHLQQLGLTVRRAGG